MFKFFILCIVVVNIFSSEFEDYLQQYNISYNKYKNDINLEFKTYKKAHHEAFVQYKNSISKYWDKVEFSNKYKWVEYTNHYQNKTIINYKKSEIRLEVISKNEKDAAIRIIKMIDRLKNYELKQAFMNDILERLIAVKLDIVREPPNTNQKILRNVISNDEFKILRDTIEQQKFKKITNKKSVVYKASVKLPSNFLLRQAKLYKSMIEKQANILNIKPELIYSIIHIESYFNPMAKSSVPAFGLMQIVPKSAGIDAIYYLKGEKKLLSSKYLYNAKNNIEIGSVYLKILFYKYLKSIKNKQSRLYCTIAAYNTGTSNVAKAFIGTKNIQKAILKINNLSSDQVHKRLIKKLPFRETKKYIYKVRGKIKMYKKLINEKKL